MRNARIHHLMNSKKIEIENGDQRLHAKLELPADGKIVQYALFAHCFTCNSDLGVVRHISRALTLEGIAVLRFDFTGLGKSEGTFEDSNFSSNVSDLICVYNYMAKAFEAPELLIGHSLGGTAVLMAATQLPDIKALVTIGSPADPAHVCQLFSKDLPTIEESGEAEVNIGGRPFKIKKQFIDDLSNAQLTEKIGELRKPYLIMHSPQDAVVAISNAAKLYSSAHHPKSFISLDGADHLLTKKEDAIYAASMIGNWSKRYITQPKEKQKPSTEDADIVAHLDLENNFTTEIYSAKHHLIADEPPKIGGDDMGMAPYELLNAALGACTTMTIKLYAERKKWELNEVFVYLTHTKIDGEATPEQPIPLKIDEFTKKVVLIGNLDEAQRQKLIEIASKCPVHRTLTRDVLIKTIQG